MFNAILISVMTLLHVYVFWRTGSVPVIGRLLSKKILFGMGLLLWAIFLLARLQGRHRTGFFGIVIEFIGMNWMGVLFLFFVSILAVDIVTGFGFLLPRVSPFFRGLALGIAGLLAMVALFQGLRPPVINSYEVKLSGLPAEFDGKVLVALSDLHIDSLLTSRWLAARVAQVQAQKPDLIVLLGDIFENRKPPPPGLVEVLSQFSAPLGVWGVLGNHEFFGGVGNSVDIYKQAGIPLLRNCWVQIQPGFHLAGVDDLTFLHRIGNNSDLVLKALQGLPEGAAILLSHTPWQAEKAAAAGANLMLSAHTHGGQLWPFNYIVRRVYPLLAGRYQVKDMTVIVCRGTGTWGPRMRLWPPGEILRITLRSEKPSSPSGFGRKGP